MKIFKRILYSRYLLLAGCMLGCIYPIYAQCKIEVDLGDTLKTCRSEVISLDAQVRGAVLFFQWSREENLDNPFSLQPMITVPHSGTYSIEVTGFDPLQNLIQNGDFENGDTLFTSHYERNSTKPGGYIIGQVGTELFDEAKACMDHTTGFGNMLMVKVSDSENVDIWCHTITVKSNQQYRFEAYATGLRINQPPIIILEINDDIISSGTLGSFACSWQKVNGDWNSGNATEATICIRVSDEDIGAATDFAIDDFGFFEVCTTRDEVEVEIFPFELSVVQDEVELPCDGSINISAFPGATDISPMYNWKTCDGNITSDANQYGISLDEPGRYITTAELDIGGKICRDSASVLVEEVSTIELIIEPPDTIHCHNPEVFLEASNGQTSSDVSYQWSTNDGLILTDNLSSNIAVGSKGTYGVTLTESATGCRVVEEVVVKERVLNDFEVESLSDFCTDDKGMIRFGFVNGSEGPYSYSIDSGMTYSNQRIYENLAAGTYVLMVRDKFDCSISKEVILETGPNFTINADTILRIEKDTPSLIPVETDIADSLIANITWTPDTGLSCTDCINPTVNLSSPQSYILEIEDTRGCVLTTSIMIIVDGETKFASVNVFSPNGDGSNDFFTIQGDPGSITRIVQLRIFDRYGNLVFQNFNFAPNIDTEGWNGMLNEQYLNPGVFIYHAEVERTDGRIDNQSGEVLLLR